jgi:hypothetical protein
MFFFRWSLRWRYSSRDAVAGLGLYLGVGGEVGAFNSLSASKVPSAGVAFEQSWQLFNLGLSW